MANIRITPSSTLAPHSMGAMERAPHPLLSWRASLAGLLAAFFTMALLASLGMAFGGIGLADGTNLENAGVFTGVWFLISSALAVFTGSYFAARISKFHIGRIGAGHGVVIVALFFGFFFYQTFATIGWAGRTVGTATGQTLSMLGQGASEGAHNPVINDAIEDALGDLNLKSDPKTVATGVMSRLLRGDTTSAKNYLAYQAGLSPQAADERIATLRAQIDHGMSQARESAAKALQGAGWSLFATLVISLLAAIGGGHLGARANIRRPLVSEDIRFSSEYSAAPT